MKKIVTLLFSALFLFLLPASVLRAQQDPQYGMYFFNQLVINPAYAGSLDQGSLTLVGRKQWLGMNGSPATASLGFHAPIGRTLHGAGLTVTQDKIGATNRFTANGVFAYRLQAGPGQLAFGLQLQGSYYSANLNSIQHEDGTDPAFNGTNISRFLPNAGIGAFYNTKNFYAGVSLPKLVNNKLYDKTATNSAHDYRHLYITTGVVVKVSEDVKLKPSILLKFSAPGIWAWDLNCSALFKERVWAGISYRHKDALVGIFQYALSYSLKFGYAYEFPISSLINNSSGGHELMLGWEFAAGKKGLLSPRYF